MDWTKIKTKHFLFSQMSDREQAGLVRILCLTAHLEKQPEHKEMLMVCGRKTLESLSNRFQSEGKSLSNVLQKVLEDVKNVHRKRNQDRLRQSTYRKSHALHRGLDKRIEDNIREEVVGNNGKKHRVAKAPQDPQEFIELLKSNPAYKGINIEKEIGKMQAWLLTPKGKGRKLTKGFIVRWLNKIDTAVEMPTRKVRNDPMPAMVSDPPSEDWRDLVKKVKGGR